MIAHRLFRRFLAVAHADDLFSLLARQQIQIIELQAVAAERELQHARIMRDLLIQMRIAIETVDTDELLPHVEAAVIDMSDQVARMEEQRG